jgi:hypothetical protein
MPTSNVIIIGRIGEIHQLGLQLCGRVFRNIIVHDEIIVFSLLGGVSRGRSSSSILRGIVTARGGGGGMARVPI